MRMTNTQLYSIAGSAQKDTTEYDVNPHKEELWKYKKELCSDEQKSQESYDKTLISLSGGALGISITLVQFFSKNTLIGQWLLMIAWVLWLLSLTGVLWGFYISVQQMRATMKILDARVHLLITYAECEKLNGELYADRYSPFIKGLNFWSGAIFCLGALAFAIFVFVNL